MKAFRDLMVWEKSHQLTMRVYRITRGFPKDELYGMTSQMRRAAVSIPANIAEGCGWRTNLDFARFLSIAMGSASELEYEVFLAKELSYLSDSDYQASSTDIIEVKKMLSSLIRKVQSDARVAHRL